MLKSCIYQGQTPDFPMCQHCNLFLETCIPVAAFDGFSNGECAAYLCESCIHHDCYFSHCVNL